MPGPWVAAFAAVLTALLAVGTNAQVVPSAAEDEKRQLLLVVDGLDRQFALVSRKPGAALRIGDTRNWLSYLKARADSWKPAEPDAGRALRLGLELDLHALMELPEDIQAAGEILNAVIDDIEVKGKHCQRKGLASLITVKVRTLRGQTEVNGLEVFYLPRLLALSRKSTPDRFPTLSASEKPLAPGRYVFWAGRASGAAAPPETTITVGDGKSEILVELLAP